MHGELRTNTPVSFPKPINWSQNKRNREIPQMPEEELRVVSRKRVMAKRAIFMLLAILLLIMVPVIMTWFGEVTGVSQFSEIYGDLIFWNELSGPSFVLAFFAVIFLTAGIMYLMMVAMDTTEGGW